MSDFCRCVDDHALGCDFYVETDWKGRAEKAEAEVKRLRDLLRQAQPSAQEAPTLFHQIKKALE